MLKGPRVKFVMQALLLGSLATFLQLSAAEKAGKSAQQESILIYQCLLLLFDGQAPWEAEPQALQSVNAAREMVGWEEIINIMSKCPRPARNPITKKNA